MKSDLKFTVEFTEKTGLVEITIDDESGLFIMAPGLIETYQSEIVGMIAWVAETMQNKTVESIAELVRSGKQEIEKIELVGEDKCHSTQ